MRHKTITLCPTTYEIAKKMPNFSAWIREELMKHQGMNQRIEAVYQMWCPEHPDLIRTYQKPPRFGVYCLMCELEMEGKWVEA